jgi:hypothetical protein
MARPLILTLPDQLYDELHTIAAATESVEGSYNPGAEHLDRDALIAQIIVELLDGLVGEPAKQRAARLAEAAAQVTAVMERASDVLARTVRLSEAGATDATPASDDSREDPPFVTSA